MTAPPPRRPWWKRKRTWAAVAAVLLIAAYPASAGPAHYAWRRDWLPVSALAVYTPLNAVIQGRAGDGAALWFDRYLIWWRSLAADHSASD